MRFRGDFVVRMTLELVVIYDFALFSYRSVSSLGQRLSDLSHFPSENLARMNRIPSKRVCIGRESCSLEGVFFKKRIVDGKEKDIFIRRKKGADLVPQSVVPCVSFPLL